MSCILKRWRVDVRWSSGATSSGLAVAATRGGALADAWRCDAFNGSTFKEFLGFARAYREREPDWWGAPITVLGEPAHFLGHDNQYVQFCRPGGKAVLNAHPYDVLPIERRPASYRHDQTEKAVA